MHLNGEAHSATTDVVRSVPIQVQSPPLSKAGLILHHGKYRLALPASVCASWLADGLVAAPAQIWLAVAPVDMRRGIVGLSSIVQHALGHSPCAGSAFVFHNRPGNNFKRLA